MALKVTIKNCQSIKEATLLIDGFTVLTGANNSGKTATQRAIRGVFTNAPVGSLVRHGEDVLSVEIEFPDGTVLLWEKSATKPINQYTINGKLLPKVGKGVPDEVAALGVQAISANREALWPQIATQFPGGQFQGPVFLLDRPGSVLAEVVADVERIGRLSSALKSCDKDKRAATDKLRVRRKDKKSLETELEGFMGLDDVVSQVDALDARIAEAVAVRTEIKALGELRDEHATTMATVSSLTGIRSLVVPSSDTISEAQEAREAIKELRGLQAQHQAAKTQVDTLGGVRGVVVPSDGAAAREAGEELRALTTLRDSWVTASSAQDRCQKAVDVAAGVTVPSDDDPRLAKVRKIQTGLTVLAELKTQFEKAKAEVSRLQGLLDEQDTVFAEADKDLRELVGDLEQCPTCQTPMADTHLHHIVET